MNEPDYEKAPKVRQTTITGLQLATMAEIADRHEWLSRYNVTWDGFSVGHYGPDALQEMTLHLQAIRRDPAVVHTLDAVTKNFTDQSAEVIIKCINRITIRLHASREAVCKRIVVGTRMVEKPDYEKAPKVQVEEEIVEWECSPLLGD